MESSNRDAAIERLRDLPEDATFDEILEELRTLAAIRRGEEAADQGRLSSHDEVRARVEGWCSKSNEPDRPRPTSATSSSIGMDASDKLVSLVAARPRT